MHGAWIYFDGFLEINFGGIGLTGSYLQEPEIKIRFPIIGTEGDGFLHFLHRRGIVLLSDQQIRYGHMNQLIVRLLLQKLVGLLLRLFEFASCNQQVCQVNTRLIIVGLQVEGACQFLIRRIPLLQLEQGLSQTIVGVAIGGIDLNCVLELDCGLAILAFVEVMLATFKVLLLAHVGIAGAAHKKD